jgi:hypothetical protein
MTTNLVSWIGLNMGLMLISSSVILKVETLTLIYLISSIFRTRPVVQSMQILFLESYSVCIGEKGVIMVPSKRGFVYDSFGLQ